MPNLIPFYQVVSEEINMQNVNKTRGSKEPVIAKLAKKYNWNHSV